MNSWFLWLLIYTPFPSASNIIIQTGKDKAHQQTSFVSNMAAHQPYWIQTEVLKTAADLIISSSYG